MQMSFPFGWMVVFFFFFFFCSIAFELGTLYFNSPYFCLFQWYLLCFKIPRRELQRRRNHVAFKSCVQPFTICIKDYKSSEENKGDTTFLVEDPLDSPPSSSSLGAKVSKDILVIGGWSRRNNLGQRSGRSINDNAIRRHDKTFGSSYVIRG